MRPAEAQADLVHRDRENEGDLHEGFNLGLDPTIAETLPSFQELKAQKASHPTNGAKDGHSNELEHGANLWPDEKVWDGAAEFVSSCSPSSYIRLTCLLKERYRASILVRSGMLLKLRS
jgi:hypothetical protein